MDLQLLAKPTTLPGTTADALSVIVPLGDDRTLEDFPASALGEGRVADVVIAAAASVSDATLQRLARRGCRSLRSDEPRGARLREGVRSTRGERVLFLHADTRLPRGWHAGLMAVPRRWGAFRLGFASEHRRARLALIAFGANLRSRLLRLPFGDQAPFATRDAYEECGGHPPWPFLDDLELSLRLRRTGPPALLGGRVRTSAHRYLDQGALRTWWLNARILRRFAAGASPAELAALYRAR